MTTAPVLSFSACVSRYRTSLGQLRELLRTIKPLCQFKYINDYQVVVPPLKPDEAEKLLRDHVRLLAAVCHFRHEYHRRQVWLNRQEDESHRRARLKFQKLHQEGIGILHLFLARKIPRPKKKSHPSAQPDHHALDDPAPSFPVQVNRFAPLINDDQDHQPTDPNLDDEETSPAFDEEELLFFPSPSSEDANNSRSGNPTTERSDEWNRKKEQYAIECAIASSTQDIADLVSFLLRNLPPLMLEGCTLTFYSALYFGNNLHQLISRDTLLGQEFHNLCFLIHSSPPFTDALANIHKLCEYHFPSLTPANLHTMMDAYFAIEEFIRTTWHYANLFLNHVLSHHTVDKKPWCLARFLSAVQKKDAQQGSLYFPHLLSICHRQVICHVCSMLRFFRSTIGIPDIPEFCSQLLPHGPGVSPVVFTPLIGGKNIVKFQAELRSKASIINAMFHSRQGSSLRSLSLSSLNEGFRFSEAIASCRPETPRRQRRL